MRQVSWHKGCIELASASEMQIGHVIGALCETWLVTELCDRWAALHCGSSTKSVIGDADGHVTDASPSVQSK
jgi:hypothetical protein